MLSLVDLVISSNVFCLKFGENLQPCASAKASSSSITPETRDSTPTFSKSAEIFGLSKMTLIGWNAMGLEGMR